MANLNINKSVLGGRLTADPELRYTQSGVSVCSFTVAVNRKFDRETTDFINCVAWNKTAEFIAKYFSKGSSICVTGSIQVRTWEDNNGAKRYATELIVDDAYFVDSNSESNTAPDELQEVEHDGDLPF